MANEAGAVVKKHSMLPVLVVLFLLAYGLMTMLIVEQGNTIESQKLLIRELVSDSTQLSAMKGKEARDKSAAGASKAPARPQANPQVNPKAPGRNGPKLESQGPTNDVRRMLVSI
jgi:hypothetical protein